MVELKFQELNSITGGLFDAGEHSHMSFCDDLCYKYACASSSNTQTGACMQECKRVWSDEKDLNYIVGAFFGVITAGLGICIIKSFMK